MVHECPAGCGASYNSRKNALRHFRNRHEGQSFTCERCSRNFTRHYNLATHLSICPGPAVAVPPQPPTRRLLPPPGFGYVEPLPPPPGFRDDNVSRAEERPSGTIGAPTAAPRPSVIMMAPPMAPTHPPIISITPREEGRDLTLAESVPRPYVCGECDMAYNTLFGLQLHAQSHSLLAPPRSSIRDSTDTNEHLEGERAYGVAVMDNVDVAGSSSSFSETVVCPSCKRSFAHASNLNRHRRFHCRSSYQPSNQFGDDYICSGSGGSSTPDHSSLNSHRTSPPCLVNDSVVQPFREDGQSSANVSDSNSSCNKISFYNRLSNDNNNSDDKDGGDNDVIPNNVVPEGFQETETGFRGRLKTYKLNGELSPTRLTIPEFLVTVFDRIVQLMQNILLRVNAFKTNLWMECEFTNVHGQTCKRAFKTCNNIVFQSTDLEELCGELFHKLVEEKESCLMKGSGWAFVRILDFEIRINVYRPLRGASYIPLPADIISRRAVVNVLNDKDQKCFKYAILSRHVNKPGPRQLFATDFTPDVIARANLDFTGLDFPVRIDQIPVFEKKNGVSVNVYGLESVKSSSGKQVRYKNIVYPLRVSKEEMVDPRDHYDLLYLTDDKTTHYALITDFARLVRSQLTSDHGRVHVCKRCFAHFDNHQVAKGGLDGARRLNEHLLYCKDHAALRTDIAEKEFIKFERKERTQRVRFTVYADFECALIPVGSESVLPSSIPAPDWDPANNRPGLPHHRHNTEDNIQSASTTTRKIHKPYAYAYYVHDSLCGDGEGDGNTYSQLRTYRGENAAEHFMRTLRDDIDSIGDLLYAERQNRPQLSTQEEANFQQATSCHICGQCFTDDAVKVRDHQHSRPFQYRGAAHRDCNLRYKEQDMVNCYFHNLSNYDAHFVVRELGLDGGDVNVLANTEEKFISLTKRFEYPGAGRHNGIGVRFVDSYRFLSRALSTLVEILPTEKLHRTRRFFPNPEHFDLVRRKGVFPYEYVSSSAVLEEPTLPPAAAFHDNLRMTDVTAEDYAHAERVWDGFNCVTLGDYADVYLKTDVVLLTDVFESFRDMCLEHYALDPAHWITLPSYAWDAMLRTTGVILDTLQDVDMYQFFEKGIRGGLTQCVTRHVLANNKFTRDEGAEAYGRDDDTFTMYYDANNLYGWAMSQSLPYGGFRWLTSEEIAKLDIMNIDDDSEIGYVLEVDLEYPRDHDIQDRHRDLPFCPEQRKAPVDQLPYPPEVLKNFSVGQSKKLMVTLMDKEHYVVHYRMLKQALQNGLRIHRVHRVVQFKQSAWLEPYVRLNTELRRQAKNKFEVELFKLMVNAVYGMSLQNVRKHIDIRLATNPNTYTKLVAKSNFRDRTWYREDLAMINMAKVRVVLDKPVYVGMVILDHSKWWMYNFHYKMMDRYGGADRIRLVYTDTDSLIYTIRTSDVYRDMLNNRVDFDTSNYPRDHICYDEKNTRVLGKFKDETDGRIIKEFVGLMSKLYCITFNGDPEDGTCPQPIKRAKGVNRAVVAHNLTMDDYKRCLFDQTVKLTENLRFQSRHHLMYTVSVRKRSLAPFDDKRYVIPEGGGINTLPWGHYGIPNLTPPLSPKPQNVDDGVIELQQAVDSIANHH